MAAQPPPQAMMQGRNDALKALRDKNVVSEAYLKQGYDELASTENVTPGDWSLCMSWFLQALCCGGGCCCSFCFEVEKGSVQGVVDGTGSNKWFGAGVHVEWCKCNMQVVDGGPKKITSPEPNINGTLGILTVQDGFVALLMKGGEPVVLGPGLHAWNDADIKFIKVVDLNEFVIKLGPYTLVIVEEGFAAITADNGRQIVLKPGTSTLLSHQNWKFMGWLSLKMQTENINGRMTTGDNIELDVRSVITWLVEDAEVAASRNVDLNLRRSNDPLELMRADVRLQVTSSLAALVGRIKFGSQGTEGMNQAAATGNTEEDDNAAGNKQKQGGRKALWDSKWMSSAVEDANMITTSYGARVLSICIQSATPSDPELVQTLQKSAVASVRAEESAKEARAAAEAEITKARSAARQAEANAKAKRVQAYSKERTKTIEAEGAAARAEAEAIAVKIKAEADSAAIKIKASAEAEARLSKSSGAKDAGIAIGESKVATSLEKMKVAYEPFLKKKTEAFFYGVDGPGALPKAILGEKLVKEVKINK